MPLTYAASTPPCVVEIADSISEISRTTPVTLRARPERVHPAEVIPHARLAHELARVMYVLTPVQFLDFKLRRVPCRRSADAVQALKTLEELRGRWLAYDCSDEFAQKHRESSLATYLGVRTSEVKPALEAARLVGLGIRNSARAAILGMPMEVSGQCWLSGFERAVNFLWVGEPGDERPTPQEQLEQLQHEQQQQEVEPPALGQQRAAHPPQLDGAPPRRAPHPSPGAGASHDRPRDETPMASADALAAPAAAAPALVRLRDSNISSKPHETVAARDGCGFYDHFCEVWAQRMRRGHEEDHGAQTMDDALRYWTQYAPGHRPNLAQDELGSVLARLRARFPTVHPDSLRAAMCRCCERIECVPPGPQPPDGSGRPLEQQAARWIEPRLPCGTVYKVGPLTLTAKGVLPAPGGFWG